VITVLHSCPNWLPITEIWVYNQIRYLPKEIENHIVCENTVNLNQFSLPNIHSLSDTPRWRYLLERSLRQLRIQNHLPFAVETAKQHSVDILHSHFGNVGWFNIEVAKQAQLKHIVTFYGYDVNSIPKRYPHWLKRYHSLFEQIDGVLCEGSHMAECIAKLGCPRDKIRVQHLGVAVDEIAFQPRVWNPTEPLRVLIAASFREKKGIPYALEALGRFQQQTPLEITIVGDASSDAKSQAEKQKILATIEQYNLQSKVRLLGYQPHAVFLAEAYQHHVFLSPSVTASDGDTEGGAPVGIIEMAATGMPLISTKHCDIPEVIQDGVTGLLAAETNVDELINHLQWLVNHPQEWGKMLEAGRKRVELEYNAQLQGEKLGNIYQEIISNISGNCRC
jgi:colanic acid/amylovoran biosynthesis glycosyltransferase